MISIHSQRLADIPPAVAEECAELCHEGSEMEGVFLRLARGQIVPSDEEGFVAYAWAGYAKHGQTVGWVSLTFWIVGNDKRPQVQVYVAVPYRSRSLATALCACLHDEATRHSLVCVFSDEALSIARRLGWRANQYRSVDDGWIGVGSTHGAFIGAGDDAAGLHAAASEVCDLPLAGGEEGQDA